MVDTYVHSILCRAHPRANAAKEDVLARRVLMECRATRVNPDVGVIRALKAILDPRAIKGRVVPLAPKVSPEIRAIKAPKVTLGELVFRGHRGCLADKGRKVIKGHRVMWEPKGNLVELVPRANQVRWVIRGRKGNPVPH